MLNLPCCVLLASSAETNQSVFRPNLGSFGCSNVERGGMQLKRQLKFCAVVCVTLPVIGESGDAG